MSTNRFIKCPGCGSLVMDIKGPVHKYIGAVAGCWNIYGKVLAKEFGIYDYPAVHRLTVDAYSAQHPGNESVLTTQSVAVHLLGLFFTLEKNYNNDNTIRLVKRLLLNRDMFYWLEPPEHLGALTIADVYKTKNLNDHARIVKEWAQEVWQSWTPHHKTIIKWAEKAD